ncbi:hypothetical protein [Thiocystis violascens]|uniref:LSDAT prokaryote domain-containing protein n=1 Tax=Thiocystis violascens (strain ATCC 17096 / DSM 198 / 6111) TaxID=765911 RepID=I3YDQ5_THIV6|nr:hypothetical protein [Thiocystis violascens]AFL75123.1 hypothetical protein Thivi_3248 [Thiocystis violascens DSM 198]
MDIGEMTRENAGLAPSEAVTALAGALDALGLSEPRPVLVLIGGAANVDPAVAEALLILFERLAPRLDALDVTVVDGGTAFGVMALMGQARHRTAARFPLVGIAALGTVALETRPSRAAVRVLSGAGHCGDTDWFGGRTSGKGARLDPNHSHFLLTPGDRWGDESAWIVAAATQLAGNRPALTLVAAGGLVTRRDVALALRAGRRLIVLAGTGGTADLLADGWRHGREIADFPLGARERALMQVVEMADAAESVAALLAQTFASTGDGKAS